ncbi:MAG TPA: inorganic phosphate transporter [Longimicrobiales bacterium]|nr:inorganic phosphate transporter [Longimicrobiales bacterium]
MTLGLIIVAGVLIAGLYMAWGIGANDVANAMGTSVGSGALTLLGAIILAGILEFSGAVLIGSNVTETISKGIIDTALFDVDGPWGADGPVLLAVGMLCALLAAASWLHIATHFGLPVSTTHSIVGAVLGIGLVSFGLSGVNWGTMLQIMASWVVSPLLGGLLAFLSFFAIRRYILNAPDPVAATIRTSPFIVAGVVMLLVLSFIYKVMSNRMDVPPVVMAFGTALAAGTVAGVITSALTRNMVPAPGMSPYQFVERVFALLQIATACFVAFAHGANDVANAIGPVAAVASLWQVGFASVPESVGVPLWVLVLGGGGIVVGLATMGYKVIATIGKEITEITPTRGFSAEFGAAGTVLLASSMGLPISTTHTLVGAVIGVGFARGIGALNLRIIRNIVNSWLATVPVAAAASALLFFIARIFVT